jgi:hypothetical protein
LGALHRKELQKVRITCAFTKQFPSEQCFSAKNLTETVNPSEKVKT